MRSPKSLRRSSLKFFFDGASVGLKREKISVCSPFLMLFLCLCFSCLFVLSLAHVMFYESISAIAFVKKIFTLNIREENERVLQRHYVSSDVL